MSSLKVCIVIPAYNEERVIRDTIQGIQKALNKSNYRYEIVVVNDGSSDNTSTEARRAGATVIDHILNSGAGGATATGLLYAKKNAFDILVTMDADGQHVPTDAIAGIDTLANSNVDLLIGSRLIDSTGMSKIKVIGNLGLSGITYLLFGTKVMDSQSGLRIFSKRAIDGLRWRTSGFEFCSEMLWRAKQQHIVVAEYPIKAVYSEYSMQKGQNNWNGINIVKSLIRRRIVETFE